MSMYVYTYIYIYIRINSPPNSDHKKSPHNIIVQGMGGPGTFLFDR